MASETEPGQLTEPLLPGTAAPADDKLIPTIRVVGVDELPSNLQKSSLALSIVILAKTILGAGMAALPKSFALLGLGFATGFLLLMGYMTHFSIEALTLGSLVTGSLSYPLVVKQLLGKAGSLVLELCLISRCAGLMIVYVIVAADILAGRGSDGMSGLLCDWLGGGETGGWCSDRRLTAGVVLVLVLMPLATPRRLSSTAITSWLGLFSVGAWALVTIILAVVALVKGEAHPMSWAPDWDALGDSSAQITTQLLAVIPILATAYTCQMSVHFVMKEMKPFTHPRVTTTSITAVSICTALFLAVAIGSFAVFGDSVPADVLENFTDSALAPLVGKALSKFFYTLVRLGFLISILANFPMQMCPYRESFSRLCFGRELEGAPFLALTYISMVAFYLIAMVAGSIWVPIQFVGATAGALIAFIFPALVALRSCDYPRVGPAISSPRFWKINGWALIVAGVVQGVTGVGAIFLKPASAGGSSGGGNGLGLWPAGLF